MTLSRRPLAKYSVAMSQANVEILRASLSAFNRGDLEGGLKDFDPHVVIRLDAEWPENRPRLGAEEARRFFEDLFGMLGGTETAIEDVIDAGDRVVMRYRSRVRGQRSGIEDEVLFTQVVTFRLGKVVMLEYFLDHQAALETVGLSD